MAYASARVWRPCALLVLLLAGFDVAAWALLRFTGPSLDFAAGGHTFAHIADRSLTPLPVIQNAAGAWPLYAAYLGVFAIAFFIYERIAGTPRLSARTVWLTFGGVVVCALAVPYLPTTDPYAYALYALEAGPLHLNPYASHVLGAATSPWSAQLSAMFPDPSAYVRRLNYGPLAAFAYGALALPLAKAPLGAFLLAERLFGAACVALTGVIFAQAAPSRERAGRLASYLLHPLVVFEFVAFAHGDALMILLLAGAFAAWRSRVVALAAALCTAAIAVRGVALIALIALLVALARTAPGRLWAALCASGVCAALLVWASRAAFGEVALGGAPAFNRFSAPFVLLATVAHAPQALVLGVVVEAAFGAGLILFALRRYWRAPAGNALAWLPLGALAALPTLYPHYVAWLAGVTSAGASGRLRRVTRIATLVAPVLYLARANLIAPPQPSLAAGAAVLVVCWGSVIGAYVFGDRSSERAPGFVLRERRA